MSILALLGAFLLFVLGINALSTHQADVIFSYYMSLSGFSASLMGAAYILASFYVALEWVSREFAGRHVWAHKVAVSALFLASILFVLAIGNQVYGVR